MSATYPGPDHKCSWFVEQQTDHRFCMVCGRHDPPDPRCPDRPSGLYAMLTDPGWPEMVRRIGRRIRSLP